MGNSRPIILVTGANGQLGNELQTLAKTNTKFDFIFTDKTMLPIDDKQAVSFFFDNHPVSFCINCAAYTAVDKAETEKETAFLINATGVANLAKVCTKYHSKFIHISTDYVFDGEALQPYAEGSIVNPMSVYGASKLEGERLALQFNPAAMIIRTSWLFSSYGNNFVKTMLRLMKEKESIRIVNDQHGCPTYASDLAGAIIKIITHYPDSNGIYHFCNDGITTWYEFALAIKEVTKSNCNVLPISTAQYPTVVKRPQYSVLDTSKIKKAFHLNIPQWKESLAKCISLISSD